MKEGYGLVGSKCDSVGSLKRERSGIGMCERNDHMVEVFRVSMGRWIVENREQRARSRTFSTWGVD